MSELIDLVIAPKTKDLGGFHVRRLLPYHKRRMVGPFIFFDHIGPAEFEPGNGINVRPHPHIGLATVTYLFEGEILHRDTEGNELPITPGAVNWMTAGRGISHSERTRDEVRASGSRLHGIQTWVALPLSHEETEPGFIHHPADTLPTFEIDRAKGRLIAGSGYGYTSPVEFPHPIFYATFETESASALPLPDGVEELCFYVATGQATFDGTSFSEGEMAVLKSNVDGAISIAAGTRLVIAGGAPIPEPRFIEWNFVSSSKERIEKAKADWRLSAERWWTDAPFAMPPNENEYIPLPGDPQIDPPQSSS